MDSNNKEFTYVRVDLNESKNVKRMAIFSLVACVAMMIMVTVIYVDLMIPLYVFLITLISNALLCIFLLLTLRNVTGCIDMSCFGNKGWIPYILAVASFSIILSTILLSLGCILCVVQEYIVLFTILIMYAKYNIQIIIQSRSRPIINSDGSKMSQQTQIPQKEISINSFSVTDDLASDSTINRNENATH